MKFDPAFFQKAIDHFVLGFFAAFGFFFATWISAKIPWPHIG